MMHFRFHYTEVIALINSRLMVVISLTYIAGALGSLALLFWHCVMRWVHVSDVVVEKPRS
jgi:hypothetical protein